MISKKKKQGLIDQLRKTPIVHVACKKTGIARATYYRWRKEDKEFEKASDEALEEGSDFVSDIAESQLMNAIKDRNLTAIIFWLKHHRPQYGNRMEINGHLKTTIEELSPEQEALVRRALRLSALGLEE